MKEKKRISAEIGAMCGYPLGILLLGMGGGKRLWVSIPDLTQSTQRKGGPVAKAMTLQLDLTLAPSRCTPGATWCSGLISA